MSATPARPTWLIDLAAAANGESTGGNIFRDHGTGANVGAISNSHRRDERCVTSDENATADRCRIFIDAVVVASNCSGAHVGFVSDF